MSYRGKSKSSYGNHRSGRTVAGVQRNRSFRAKLVDAGLKAPIAKSIDQWMDAPNRFDLPEVDDPKESLSAKQIEELKDAIKDEKAAGPDYRKQAEAAERLAAEKQPKFDQTTKNINTPTTANNSGEKMKYKHNSDPFAEETDYIDPEESRNAQQKYEEQQTKIRQIAADRERKHNEFNKTVSEHTQGLTELRDVGYNESNIDKFLGKEQTNVITTDIDGARETMIKYEHGYKIEHKPVNSYRTADVYLTSEANQKWQDSWKR